MNLTSVLSASQFRMIRRIFFPFEFHSTRIMIHDESVNFSVFILSVYYFKPLWTLNCSNLNFFANVFYHISEEFLINSRTEVVHTSFAKLMRTVGTMENHLNRYIEVQEKSKIKTIETRKLLEKIELDLGSERFDLQGGYGFFVIKIERLVRDSRLEAVKNSGKNGMNPPLFNKYRIVSAAQGLGEKDYKNEVLSLHPFIKKEFYLKNMKQYEVDRELVGRLNLFLQKRKQGELSGARYTMNERSFQIFNDEKFLDRHGTGFLKKVGLNLDLLNCYRTYEAFFYLSLDGKRMGNALIIENKDTFMSIVRAWNRKQASFIREQNTLIQKQDSLVEKQDSLVEKQEALINKNNIVLLIYGEGNKITKSFEFMDELRQDFQIDHFFYYGDLDYPGIDIYQRLAKAFPESVIEPHTGLYQQLIESVETPPAARNESKHVIETFLGFFEQETRIEMIRILTGRQYIPQEGLSFAEGNIEI